MYQTMSELSWIMLEMQTEMLRILAMACTLWTIAALFTSLSGLIWMLVSETRERRRTETADDPGTAGLRLDPSRL